MSALVHLSTVYVENEEKNHEEERDCCHYNFSWRFLDKSEQVRMMRQRVREGHAKPDAAH